MSFVLIFLLDFRVKFDLIYEVASVKIRKK